MANEKKDNSPKASGHRGGEKRAEVLSPAERSKIASKGGKAGGRGR